MIEYQNVVKEYQDNGALIKAVDDLSLQVESGELVVLLGPSGCGKTTLLRLTNRLEDLTAGQILINGQNILEQDEVKLRQKIGYVIQEIGLFPNKTIAENIGMVPKIIGWSAERIEKRVQELLEMMNLDADLFKDRYPAQLSGGQRQRVGVARALAADPELLLMDEPFGAIDPINRKEIQDQFLHLQDKLQKTIIFVSHDIQEALKMGDKIALINNGQVVQFGTPEEILLEPANDFVQDFVGTERAMKALDLVQVTEIMHEVEYKYKGLAVQDALTWFRKKNNEYLLICNRDQKPLGYVSHQDLVDDYAAEAVIDDYIRDLYTVLHPQDTLKEALNVMVTNEVTTLCVVEEGALVGVVKFADLQDYLSKNYRREHQELKKA
ncbi:betaine/proline/choline family ABC transporter ATP-binding protein [Halanaerobacter jeridensis]|uniref:Quaternary amine transport ATP-binding protein n=1 Tax=Halanaerobacter jeridensis TaxID=706427 RepID=A0A938XPQ8_9FIRM|nr:osmoprotectant transport system ATP-binding protein [Halanaerobacter jeridensis]